LKAAGVAAKPGFKVDSKSGFKVFSGAGGVVREDLSGRADDVRSRGKTGSDRLTVKMTRLTLNGHCISPNRFDLKPDRELIILRLLAGDG
jgi:hypothetical protein